MNLSEFAQYIGDTEKAEQAPIEKGILKRYDVCPFWGEGWIGRVLRARTSVIDVTKREVFVGIVPWKG